MLNLFFGKCGESLLSLPEADRPEGLSIYLLYLCWLKSGAPSCNDDDKNHNQQYTDGDGTDKQP